MFKKDFIIFFKVISIPTVGLKLNPEIKNHRLSSLSQQGPLIVRFALLLLPTGVFKFT